MSKANNDIEANNNSKTTDGNPLVSLNPALQEEQPQEVLLQEEQQQEGQEQKEEYYAVTPFYDAEYEQLAQRHGFPNPTDPDNWLFRLRRRRVQQDAPWDAAALCESDMAFSEECRRAATAAAAEGAAVGEAAGDSYDLPPLHFAEEEDDEGQQQAPATQAPPQRWSHVPLSEAMVPRAATASAVFPHTLPDGRTYARGGPRRAVAGDFLVPVRPTRARAVSGGAAAAGAAAAGAATGDEPPQTPPQRRRRRDEEDDEEEEEFIRRRREAERRRDDLAIRRAQEYYEDLQMAGEDSDEENRNHGDYGDEAEWDDPP